MLKRVSMLTAIAVGLLSAAASQAASVILSLDTVQYSPVWNFSSGVTTVPVVAGSSNTTVVVPRGVYYVRYNVRAFCTGDVNLAAATGYQPTQPPVLGIAGFGASVTNSNRFVAEPIVADLGAATAVVNSLFADLKSPGRVAADGGIGTDSANNRIFGSTFSVGVNAANAANFDRLTLGANPSGSVLFSQLTYRTGSPLTAPTVLTTTFQRSSFFLVTNNVVGNANTPPTYNNRGLGTADTLTGPGTLTIMIAPEPASLAVITVIGVGLLGRRRHV